ncbi:MAG: Kiwa anti-phage protein KwaB-like domain-containing protein [Gaiellaceae bacterium]|jgi:hypothetical protein
MTARERLDDLASAFVADGAVAGVLEAATVARPPAPDALPEGRVLALAEDAELYFRSLLTEAVVALLEGGRLRKFDPLYKPDADEVEWARIDDIPAAALAVDRYANLSPLAPFDPADESYKRRMRYWVAVVTAADRRQAFFFRSFSASAELRRKRGAALVSRNGTFTRVDEHIFLFDRNVDCFVFGEYVFVLRHADFRRIFEQLDVVRRRAARAARDVLAKVPIANAEDFIKACSSQAAMAEKLLAVRERDYFDRLSYAMLAPVIEEFNLNIPTRDEDGTAHLVFESTPEQRWRILKLIDDDYLRSAMTSHRYEVNSKTDPPAD